jgi:hypothetical protein
MLIELHEKELDYLGNLQLIHGASFYLNDDLPLLDTYQSKLSILLSIELGVGSSYRAADYF